MKIAKIAPYAGLICFIHCVSFPLLVTVLPLIGPSFILNRWVDWAILGVGILCTAFSLCWGFPKHRQIWPAIFFFGAICWYWLAHQPCREYKHWVYLGLAVGYFTLANLMNNRLCKSCGYCNHER